MTPDNTPARLAVLEHRVEHIETAIASIDASLREMSKALAVLAEQTQRLQDHEKRLRSVEGFAWKATGALLIVSVGAQAVMRRLGFS